jgi:hypothetical protein
MFLFFIWAIELIRYSPYTIKEREELCDFFSQKQKSDFFLYEKSVNFTKISYCIVFIGVSHYYYLFCYSLSVDTWIN